MNNALVIHYVPMMHKFEPILQLTASWKQHKSAISASFAILKTLSNPSGLRIMEKALANDVH